MLDRDLAKLYGVETRVLNQAVKRNIKRFPKDFMFSLTRNEILRISQFVTSLKFSKSVYVFTEHGSMMAASVLNTQRAIDVGIYVVRAFVKLREMLSTHREVAKKLLDLEGKIENHDQHIHSLFEAIRQLMSPPEPKRKRIGFHRD